MSEADPSRSEEARELFERRAFGTLATNLKRMAGYPFGSIMPYAADAHGRPVFLLSRLAVHTKNLAENPRASLLVFEEGAEEDALNSPRLNLIGDAAPIPDEDLEEARKAYLARHPDASEWIEFGDFALYRMTVLDIYWIGGFGQMGWISRTDW